MNVKKINAAVMAVFAVMIILPFICMDRISDTSKHENRKLAEEPLKAAANGARYADAVDSYMNDRIGFREQLLSLHGSIKYYIFGQTPSNDVIIGKNGWLFYNNAAIPQFIGGEQCLYDDNELEKMKNNLLETEEYLKKRNCEFIIVFCPNKERVYSEYMPDKYQKIRQSEKCNTEQLVDYIRENTDIKVVWPYEDLLDFKEKYPDVPIYYHLDTHWNYLGGYIGARAVLSAMNIDIPEPDPDDFEEQASVNSGDLKKMMSLDTVTMHDVNYIPKNYPDKNADFDDGETTGYWKFTSKNKDPRKVLISRDSFTTAMRDVLGSEFNTITMHHHGDFSQDMIDEEKPNVFIYEIVERYDDDLLKLCLSEDDKQE